MQTSTVNMQHPDHLPQIQPGFTPLTPPINEKLALEPLRNALGKSASGKSSDLYHLCDRKLKGGEKEVPVVLIAEKITQDDASFQCSYYVDGKLFWSRSLSADFFPGQYDRVYAAQKLLAPKRKSARPGPCRSSQQPTTLSMSVTA